MFSEQQVIAEELYALVMFLMKTTNNDLLDTIGESELSLTQVKVLHHLEHAGSDLSVKDVSELIPVSLPAGSRAVDELVQRGLVARHEDCVDRRIKRLQATDAGRALIRRLNAARLSGFQQFTATLSSEERSALAGTLATLLRREEIATCRPTTENEVSFTR